MVGPTAEAEWNGALADGAGTMKLGSGAFEGRYSFASRFEQGTGTNPEELIAAAHAGCFSMALVLILGQAGFTPRRIHTTARTSIEKAEDGFRIPQIHLDTEAEVPGIDEAKSANAPKPQNGIVPCLARWQAPKSLSRRG